MEATCQELVCRDCENEIEERDIFFRPWDAARAMRHWWDDHDGNKMQCGPVLVCGAPIPRLCGAAGCHHRRGDHDETEIYNVVTPVCYGAQRDGVACEIAHLYSPGPLASECANGHPVAVPTEAERRG